eukprot:15473579-Alexandrium_andersonii.AAC.1
MPRDNLVCVATPRHRPTVCACDLTHCGCSHAGCDRCPPPLLLWVAGGGALTGASMDPSPHMAPGR